MDSYQYNGILITTMLDRTYHISSDWFYFSQECNQLETVFLKLKYLRKLFNLTFDCQAIHRIPKYQTSSTLYQPKRLHPPSKLSYCLKIWPLLMKWRNILQTSAQNSRPQFSPCSSAKNSLKCEKSSQPLFTTNV